ncbi:MAG: hypothetical protein ACFFG0_07125 [Candidatus Thorarchaeota archaeon]
MASTIQKEFSFQSSFSESNFETKEVELTIIQSGIELGSYLTKLKQTLERILCKKERRPLSKVDHLEVNDLVDMLLITIRKMKASKEIIRVVYNQVLDISEVIHGTPGNAPQYDTAYMLVVNMIDMPQQAEPTSNEFLEYRENVSLLTI